MGANLRVIATTFGGLLLVSLASSCRDEQKVEQQVAAPPPDHLAPGEHLPDTELTFGIEVPRGMRVTARFPDVAQLDGSLGISQLVSYYKQHVAVAAVEMGASQAVFPRAYIRGDEKKHIYRIVISKHGKRSKVRISDITGAPVVEGLSEEQRWERAGLQQDGTQKDRLKVY